MYLTKEQQKNNPKPILKWAGGKTQLIDELIKHIPLSFNKYIEPFLGGGALFFYLSPENSIIADSNPELINLYNCIAQDYNLVAKYLSKHRNEKEYFLGIRKQRFSDLNPFEAAARTIFLNKTCFNGLYRVNKQGGFNVPYGHYKNPKIIDIEALMKASLVLEKAKIICGDYKNILDIYGSEGDLVYLDPPYLPISEYSDFKRYTKEQFYEEDHIELAGVVKKLVERNCHVILTNSNHPLVHELYSEYDIEVISSKRNINIKGNKRTGEDVIINAKPNKRLNFKIIPKELPQQMSNCPPTRFMGSKFKLVSHIWEVAKKFDFESVLDLFSGSSAVSYMFKVNNKQVYSNDYMALSYNYAKSIIENNHVTLGFEKAKDLLIPKVDIDNFVQKTFKGLYYTDEENRTIDIIRYNIKRLENQYERAIALFALTRACIQKRPRGIFTYTGYRYDDGRKDLKMSFEEQFLFSIKIINKAVFDNKKQNKARRGEALSIKQKADLVYIDPPYYSPFSDNEYVRRYHFVEGLACDWKDVDMQWHTKTKKFKSYPTPFSSRNGAHDAFDKLFRKHADSVIIVSYSSNSLPTLDEMVGLLAKYKRRVEVIAIDYKYSFANQRSAKNVKNDVKEYLFVGY